MSAIKKNENNIIISYKGETSELKNDQTGIPVYYTWNVSSQKFYQMK